MQSKFIPGIYLYCDQWCERCHLKFFCSAFANNSMLPDANGSEYMPPEGLPYLEHGSCDHCLSERERQGYDKGSMPGSGNGLSVSRCDDEALCHVALEYAKSVYAWFEKNRDEIRSLGCELATLDKHEKWKFEDVILIFYRYGYLIYHKLIFALDNHANIKVVDGDKYLGAVKVALIACEKTQGALCRLLKWWDNEDEILEFLLSLNVLKKRIIASFPKAPHFKRPGFDIDEI